MKGPPLDCIVNGQYISFQMIFSFQAVVLYSVEKFDVLVWQQYQNCLFSAHSDSELFLPLSNKILEKAWLLMNF